MPDQARPGVQVGPRPLAGRETRRCKMSPTLRAVVYTCGNKVHPRRRRVAQAPGFPAACSEECVAPALVFSYTRARSQWAAWQHSGRGPGIGDASTTPAPRAGSGRTDHRERHESRLRCEIRRAQLGRRQDHDGHPRRAGQRPVRQRRADPGWAQDPAVQARLQEPAGHRGARRAARRQHRRHRGARHEDLGDGTGRDPLHPLVPAADRLDRREARLVPEPGR